MDFLFDDARPDSLQLISLAAAAATVAAAATAFPVACYCMLPAIEECRLG